MKAGVFQFAGSGDIQANCRAIIRGMRLAAQEGVRLLVFPECALTGYPPVETDIEGIDYAVLEICLNEIKAQAKHWGCMQRWGVSNRKRTSGTTPYWCSPRKET